MNSSTYNTHVNNPFEDPIRFSQNPPRNSRPESTSINDFADTSSERSRHEDDYDSESVESILHEYSDDKEKENNFLFKEHFDEKSLASKNSLSRNKSVKSIIERTLNESRNSYGTESSRSRNSGSRYSTMSGNKSREILIYQDQPTESKEPSSVINKDYSKSNNSLSTSFQSERFFDAHASDTDKRFFDTTNSSQANTSNGNSTRANSSHFANTSSSNNSNSNNTNNDISEHQATQNQTTNEHLNSQNQTNNFTTSSSEPKNDTTSSTEDRKKFFDTVSDPSQTTNTNESSERPLEGYDPRRDSKFKHSMISLNSEELINRLDRSLSNLSERSQAENVHDGNELHYGNSQGYSSHSGTENHEVITAYRVSQNQSPKLIEIHSPNLNPLEPVHYHDSDISSGSSMSIYSNDELIDKEKRNHNDEVMTYAKYKAYGGSRRPPPEAPTKDTTLRSSVHEKMLGNKRKSNYNPFSPRTEISGFPVINSADNSITSPEFTDSFEEQEYSYYHQLVRGLNKPQYFGWTYFMVMMLLGLIIPPTYFLLSLGISDKLKNSKNYYTGIYYKQQYLINRAKVIKYSPLQKLISLAIGLLWTAVILAMIGVGFGLTQP